MRLIEDLPKSLEMDYIEAILILQNGQYNKINQKIRDKLIEPVRRAIFTSLLKTVTSYLSEVKNMITGLVAWYEQADAKKLEELGSSEVVSSMLTFLLDLQAYGFEEEMKKLCAVFRKSGMLKIKNPVQELQKNIRHAYDKLLFSSIPRTKESLFNISDETFFIKVPELLEEAEAAISERKSQINDYLQAIISNQVYNNIMVKALLSLILVGLLQ